MMALCANLMRWHHAMQQHVRRVVAVLAACACNTCTTSGGTHCTAVCLKLLVDMLCVCGGGWGGGGLTPCVSHPVSQIVSHSAQTSCFSQRLKRRKCDYRVRPDAQPVWEPPFVQTPQPLSCQRLAQAVTDPAVAQAPPRFLRYSSSSEYSGTAAAVNVAAQQRQ